MNSLDLVDYALIQRLQRGISLSPRPFADVGAELGVSEQEVLERVRALAVAGSIRRMGAFIRHQWVGYTANAMVVWDVAEHDLAAVAERLCSNECVSHCYSRIVTSTWPYRLYAMVHGHSREAVLEMVGRLAAEEGIRRYEVLFSTRELKKTAWVLPAGMEGENDGK